MPEVVAKQYAKIANVVFLGGRAHGICVSHPRAGRPANPFLDARGLRVGEPITTSRVMEWFEGGFETENTIYQIVEVGRESNVAE